MSEWTTRRDIRRSTRIAKRTVCSVDHKSTPLGDVERSKHAKKKTVASEDRDTRKRVHKTDRTYVVESTRYTRSKTSEVIVDTKRDKRTGKGGGVSGHTKRVLSKTPTKMEEATGTRKGKGKRTPASSCRSKPKRVNIRGGNYAVQSTHAVCTHVVPDRTTSESPPNKSDYEWYEIATFGNTRNCHMTGVEFLTEGRILLADRIQQSIKLFTQFGELLDELKLESYPYSCAMIDNNTAAVPLPAIKKIQLINVGQRLSTKGFLQVDCYTQFIATCNTGLATTYQPNAGQRIFGLQILTLEGRVVKELTTDMRIDGHPLFKQPHCITSNAAGTILYISDWATHEVVALTCDGDVVFRYKHNKLRGPWGVAVDGNGDVYVCGRSSNNVHQITPGGQHIRIIPIKITGPLVISFQPGGRGCVVTHDSENHPGSVRVFNLG
jgi:hypothetical protein